MTPYILLPLLAACTSSLTGNEGNLTFTYLADDRLTDFNKPVAVGAFLDLDVWEVGTLAPVDLTAASFDDEAVLAVDSFAGNRIVIEGMGDGGALLSVEATTLEGEALTDSVNMLASTPEVLRLAHTCEVGATAGYLAGQQVGVPFEMEMSNGQPVIGYGYYPVTPSSEGVTLLPDESDQQWLALQVGDAEGTVDLVSSIDATTLTLQVWLPASIDGVQEPIPFVVEDIDVGDSNAFFVRPMAAGLPVCQADVAVTVTSDTPEICTVQDTEPVAGSDGGEHEYGWFEVTGVAQGTCRYTVTYPDGLGGAGVSGQFSFEIQP